MRVTFYGVRGSTPCDSDAIARYGGNTSCVAVDVPGEPPLLFDLGTGLRMFGHTQRHDGSFRGSCLLSHLHWDHTQGLPFFSPLLCSPGARLDVYAPAQPDGRRVAEVFGSTIRPPLFPVTLDQFPGVVTFHDLQEGELSIGRVRVLAREVPHIGRTFGYRIEADGVSVAYISDHQQPHDGSFSVTDGVMELADGVDLLIHDSQYTVAEFGRKCDWGHCTVEYAAWLAGQAGVKRLALFHHDPMRSDDELDDSVLCASELGRRRGFEVLAAAERSTIDLS